MAQTKQKGFLIGTLILTVLAVSIFHPIFKNAMKDQVEVLEGGDKATEFTLVDFNRVEYRLSDYKG